MNTPAAMPQNSTHVSGEVQSVRVHNCADDWSVLVVTCRDSRKPVVVVGYTACHPGQRIEADGEWQRTSQYGLQFQAKRVLAQSPVSRQGLVSYIGSGVLPGVGPVLAEKLVEAFGMHLLDVLDDEPEKLRSVRGIGPAKAASITVGWKAQAALREIMLFLHSQGLPSGICRRIHKAFGDQSLDVIRADPYRLCVEVSGIGFATADEIAANLAVPRNSEQRVRAGITYQLNDLTKAGNCGARVPLLLKKCSELLGLPESRVQEVLGVILSEPPTKFGLVQDAGAVYPVRLARAEEDIASALARAAGSAPWYAPRVTADLISRAARECGMVLAQRQVEAVHASMTHSIAVITGGPGCGKTSTLQVLLRAFKRLNVSVSLCAPTGRAAQRAWEATGVEARTIHRLLGLSKEGDEADSTVHSDVVVVDETSMVDVPLMARLVRALHHRVSLVLVGDVDQLPSVGPGQVLADIIHSGVVPVTVLDQVFRQAAGSAIITNAYAINHGSLPHSAGKHGDFFLLTEDVEPTVRTAASIEDKDARPAAVATAVADAIDNLVARRLPATYHVDPIRDIQVLAPMHKGACGVQQLNLRLQRLLNPAPVSHIDYRGTRLGVGDKVIQRRNNYALDIYNGDIGYVAGIGNGDEVLDVQFDKRTVPIPFDDLGDLSLAYAITIHKSQGSQAPVVVIPMVTQHQIMLQRNLLYTGVTRASKLCIVIGQNVAIRHAVRNADSAKRTTRLRTLLAGEHAERPSTGPAFAPTLAFGAPPSAAVTGSPAPALS